MIPVKLVNLPIHCIQGKKQERNLQKLKTPENNSIQKKPLLTRVQISLPTKTDTNIANPFLLRKLIRNAFVWILNWSSIDKLSRFFNFFMTTSFARWRSLRRRMTGKLKIRSKDLEVPKDLRLEPFHNAELHLTRIGIKFWSNIWEQVAPPNPWSNRSLTTTTTAFPILGFSLFRSILMRKNRL